MNQLDRAEQEQLTVEPHMEERVQPSYKNVHTGERQPEQRWQEQKGWTARRGSLQAWAMDRHAAVSMLGFMEGAKRTAQLVEAAEQERDLAIAHDTQPYPTAEAYEKVCAARTKWQERAERAEAALDEEAT